MRRLCGKKWDPRAYLGKPRNVAERDEDIFMQCDAVLYDLKLREWSSPFLGPCEG